MTAPQPTHPERPTPRATREPDGGVPARLRADVAARLGPVCAGMAPEHFERLVEDVTRFTLRWSSPDGAPAPRAD